MILSVFGFYINSSRPYCWLCASRWRRLGTFGIDRSIQVSAGWVKERW